MDNLPRKETTLVAAQQSSNRITLMQIRSIACWEKCNGAKLFSQTSLDSRYREYAKIKSFEVATWFFSCHLFSCLFRPIDGYILTVLFIYETK